MADLNVRSDSVDVEQIMKQIRTRIREKRGTDYTDAELQRLASVKLEQFADPSGLRSDLLVQFQQKGNEPSTYHRHRGPRRWVLMLLHPLLKRIQKQLMSDLNLYFEIIHNLVIETTRLGIEVQNLKMRVESLSSRVDFDERRGRALEQVVQYRAPRQQNSDQSRQQNNESRHQNNDGRQRHENQQRHQQHQPQQNQQPQPQQQTPAVSYGASVTAPTTAPAAATPAAPGSDAANGNTGNRPPDQTRPDGSRRRRRRRRRRPGNSMAQGPGQPNNGAPNAGFTPNSNVDSSADGGDDGPDDGDDSPEQ